MSGASPPAPGRGSDGFAAEYLANAAALITWLRWKTARVTGAKFEVEDIAQEVWLRALTNQARFDANLSRFRTWLFGIAANVLLELRARSLRLARVRAADGESSIGRAMQSITDTVTSITGQLVRNEAIGHLLAAVERCDAVDHRVFQLRGLEERPHAEVAQMLGLSIEAAAKRWSRLLDSLRDHKLPAGLLAEP
ncbi:MAG: sigma-70 family RNA polymerase sigma factor [Planctomycetota bacterium]